MCQRGYGEGELGREVTSLVFCGVGGQGVVLASEVMAEVALLSGLDVKKSEIHGMAQRGGSVSSHVRFGEEVYSPTIPLGGGDFLVSFEELEALRYSPYLKRDAIVIVNTQRINPITVLAGTALYPQDCLQMLKKKFKQVKPIEAMKLAVRAGSPKAVNSVMMGVLSRILPFELETWLRVLNHRISSKVREVNIRAFQLGRGSSYRE